MTDPVSRRTALRAAAATAMLPAAQAGFAAPALPAAAGDTVRVVQTRGDLARIADRGGIVFLAGEAGRSGMFRWSGGDMRAGIAADPQQGLHIPPAADPGGASGCWVRDWDGTEGRPEWFGATPDAPNADNRGAFGACLAMCPVMRLGAGDYWIHGRWQVMSSYRSVIGTNRNGDGSPGHPGTRICLDSATEDLLFLGTDTNPGAINAFVRFVDFRSITFYHVAAPTPPASGIWGGPSCVRGQYILNCAFRNCYAVNGTNGYYFMGAVYSQIEDCGAQRIRSGTTSANDYYIGCMLDGTPDDVANTAIASFYIRKLSVQGRGRSYGLFTFNGMTDMYIDSIETSGVQYGAILNGKPSVTYGSENGKIFNCVFDQCITGIQINAGQSSTAIVAQNNYVATAFATKGSTGILITGTPTSGKGGSISLIGNQIIGGGNGSIGIKVDRSSGVQSFGNIITDVANPIMLTDAARCSFADRISNPAQTADGAAALLRNVTRAVLDLSVDGKQAAFPAGVDLTDGNESVEVRVTGIDPDAIAGGAGRKIVHAGTPVAAAGSFGKRCLAQGIF